MPPPGPSYGESARRSGRSGYDSQRYERREKAKSTQSYEQYHGISSSRIGGGSTRGGVRPGNGYATATAAAGVVGGHAAEHDQRPRPKTRTNSAPLVEVWRTDDQGVSLVGGHRSVAPAPSKSEHATRDVAVEDGQDEDEVAGVVGAVRTFYPFHNPQLLEPLPEINIAVIGAEGVGKSTFVQKALGLPTLPPSQAAEQEIPIDGSVYLVRLLELPIEDIDINDDDTINWPDTIEDKMMPKVDGALTLYDVQDRESVEELPEMLNAITKASLPNVLVSCKCDTPPSERELDPELVELNARRAIGSIYTLQASELAPQGPKQGVYMLIESIVTTKLDGRSRSQSASRRRAKSTAVRSVSPRQTNHIGHSRASSEHTGGLQKDQRHGRHDSSMIGHNSHDHLRIPRGEAHMHSSYLLESSTPSDRSPASSLSSISIETQQAVAGASALSQSLVENGATFDELVDRLLSQPTSKTDLKFAAIFLALYRKFAAPGRLLEAIVERFDALERNGSAQILKTQTQLRYVGLIEQWVGCYPGDFAYPRTKRRLQTFVAKLAELRIFAQAAKEINIDLEAVREDDDTNWAYSDKNRNVLAEQSRISMSSSASTLIDDPTFTFEQELSGSTLSDDVAPDHLPKFANQLVAHVEKAQRQAELLQAIPRNPITKIQWRALMDQPDELIARELTRIDWVMFSAIRPRDLVRHVSLSKTDKTSCHNLAHVSRMTDHFNQLARWVENYVLLRDKPKHRALMLEKFMRVARKLRELNNYNSLGAIIAGVKATSVHRLAATRDLLPQAVGKDWLKLDILMAPSRSYFAYRLAWENSSTERIPYLPLHRRDLATAEEGNKTFIGDEKEGRINWKKFEIMGDVIVSLQRAQGMPYKNLGGPKANEAVRELILDVRLVKDEEELYERSLQCEPAASAQGSSTKFKDFFKR